MSTDAGVGSLRLLAKAEGDHKHAQVRDAKNCSLLMCWWKKEPPLKRLTYILKDFIIQKEQY